MLTKKSRATVSVDPSSTVIRIEPSKGWVPLRFREIWEYRGLLYFLTWRDIKVQYKQTVLGIAWAVIRPVFTMVVFSIFFGKLAKIPSDGLPYPIFAYTALVPWSLFSGALTSSSTSLVGSSNLIKKVYFPRLVIPMSAVLSSVPDFLISFIVLAGMMFAYGIYPTVAVVWLPLLVLLIFITCLGVGLWLSALNVEYRDVRYIVPFLLQFWLFITPIAYPATLLREPFRTIYALNPMAGVIEGFRWALLGTSTKPGAMMIASSIVSILVLIGGAFYFRRMERNFADVL